MFVSNNNQTPVDIAGDLGHFKCLEYLVEHFYWNHEERIRSSFITTEMVNKFSNKRFAQRRTKAMKIQDGPINKEVIRLTTFSSENFTNE